MIVRITAFCGGNPLLLHHWHVVGHRTDPRKPDGRFFLSLVFGWLTTNDLEMLLCKYPVDS